MRTKTLILSAMLGASGIVSSFAQNVYSVNVVGYINLTVPIKWNLIGNQLDDGQGNLVTNLFKAAPAKYPMTIFKFNGTTYNTVRRDAVDEWTFSPDGVADQMTLGEGEGVFVKNGGLPLTPLNFTFVGEVRQGTRTVTVKKGFDLYSTPVPQQGGLQAVHNFVPANQDKVFYGFNANGVSYLSSQWIDADGEWTSGDPIIKVGEGFWIQKRGDAAPWTRVFNVNP